MINQNLQQNNDASSLNELLSSMDESLFLVKLSAILSKVFGQEMNEVFLYRADNSVSLMAQNGEKNSEINYAANEAIFNYLNKIKRPYFSNSVSRDPLFSTFLKKRPVTNNLERELIYPVISGNRVLFTIHLRSSNHLYSDKDFTRVRDFISTYSAAFENFSNYMMASYVNNQIMNKFETSSLDKAVKNTVANTDSDQVLGLDKRMQLVRQTIDKASQGDFPILIEGKLGSGKRFVAKKIHAQSMRSASQLISFECGVKDEDSLEKELFGFMDRIGMLEHANNGTIILSDIHELPLTVQSKLVQFMTAGWILRVNGKDKINLNVRIIATSKLPLIDLVAAKKFREDLYYRLSTLSVKIPSLTERKDDIKLLADHFLNLGKTSKKYLSGSILKKLEEHSWEANILELKSIMERAYMLTDGDCVDSIEINSIKPVVAPKVEETVVAASNIADEEITLFELEKKFIFKTLVRLGGNKTKAAKALGITVKTLYNKLHSYGVEFEEKISALN
jgi:DNA-binding NtrC family response regulator